MAESAKILNPEKTVLLPAPDAGCPMADMIEPEDIARLRAEHPGAAVVCYVNSSAAVKAVSDICCTSSSAVSVVRSLPQKRVIFVPDKNLGAYVARRVPEKEFIFFDGFCPIHDYVTVEMVAAARAAWPNAAVAVHPECKPEVCVMADFVGSTAQMVDFVVKSPLKDFIIGTEMGVAERIMEISPDKNCRLLTPRLVCPNMKRTDVSDVVRCLEGEAAPVTVPDDVMDASRSCLEKMISV